jgi:hypothetical protein
LLYAALIPHLFDVTERDELLAGDHFALKSATPDFPPKPRNGHATVRKGNLDGIL